jgi:hypothetical protein
MGDYDVVAATARRLKKSLVVAPIRFISRTSPIPEFVDYVESLTPAQLAALSELIVDRFLTLLIGGDARVQSGFHGCPLGMM